MSDISAYRENFYRVFNGFNRYYSKLLILTDDLNSVFEALSSLSVDPLDIGDGIRENGWISFVIQTTPPDIIYDLTRAINKNTNKDVVGYADAAWDHFDLCVAKNGEKYNHRGKKNV